MIRIAEVNPNNAEIRDLIRRAHDETFGSEAPPPEFENVYWWIAWDGNAPAGFAALQASQQTEGAGYLSRCGVLIPYRGHGLQRRFIRVREAKARKLEWAQTVSDTTSNIYSANSLIREGYTLFTPRIPYAFKHSLYWRKTL